MLPQEIKAKIVTQARGSFAESTEDFEETYCAGYIAGAEREAERAQGVIEALEYLINDVKRKPNDTRYLTALKKATEALHNYNNAKS